MSPSLEQLAAQFRELVGAGSLPSAGSAPVVAGLDEACEGSAKQAEAGAPPPSSANPPAASAQPGSATLATAPAPAAPVAPATPSPSPVNLVDFARKGFHLDVSVAPAQVVAAARILDQAGFGLDAITGVDWIAQQEMEVVYDFFHPTSPLRAVVRTRLPRAHPEVPTIIEVFPGANWHERETHDFFGIRFAGHPNLKPLLLPEDADFHPLRKDYQP